MFVLVFLVCLGCVVTGQENDIKVREEVPAPVTRNQMGTFRGTWMTSRGGRQFEAYRGIKYAYPPVGELRFQPPIPILHYEDVVDATEDGPACPQTARAGYPISEDCLVVNVYTLGNNSKNLRPVIVYIHGGGFSSMSGRSDLIGPHYLLDKDVVLVTFNYRLGALGFLALGTEFSPGNNGLKDQVMALRWVQKNIAAFGGDPNLVTITGCSAGSTSVILHMISPMSEGLFHRAISMSGSPTKTRTQSNRLDLANKQARIVNCPANRPNVTKLLYECLKTKTWMELAGNIREFFHFGYDPQRLWTAVVEPDFGQERFLHVDPIDAIKEKNMHAVPFIIGMTKDEFFWKAFTIVRNSTLMDRMEKDWDNIAPIAFDLPAKNSSDVDRPRALRSTFLRGKKLTNDSLTADRLGKLYGDSITAFAVHRMAVLMAIHSPHPVYYYGFFYIGNHSHYEDSSTRKPVGVAHLDDLIYLFTLSNRFPAIEVSDSEDSKMVDKMTTIWYNFAKTGNPNPGPGSSDLQSTGPFTWPAMTLNNRTYLQIDKEFSVHTKLFENRFEVWEDLYRIDYGSPRIEDEDKAPINSAAWLHSSLITILISIIMMKH